MWTPAEELKARQKAGEGIAVSIRARPCGTVLIESEGLSTRIGVGAHDLSVESWLHIVNRDLGLDGPLYTQVSRVHSGMVLLDVNGLRGSDHASCTQGGLTIRTGHGEPPAHGGERISMTDDPERPTYTWRVVGHHGRCAFLVIPEPLDSQQIADMLEDHMTGDFHIERVDTATVTASPSLVVPGWLLNVGPAHEPETRLDRRFGA